MEPRRSLLVMWEGGGNVPSQLGLARELVARGHETRQSDLVRDTDGQPVDGSTDSPSSTCAAGIPWHADQTTPAATTQGREP